MKLETGRFCKIVATVALRARAYIFCARPRTIDVGAREMPRSVVTAGPLCNEGQFAEKIARFANLEFDVS
jgi:hypothetical protein